MGRRLTSLEPLFTGWVPVAILGGVILMAASAVLFAGRRGPDRIEIDLSEMAPVKPSTTEDAEVLRVAVATMLTPQSNFGAYQKITDYLGSQLQRRVEMVQRSSYGEVNALLANGEVDLAFVCSGAYVDLRDRGAAELLVVPVVDGNTTYQSWVIVRSGVETDSFEDLLGNSFAFVDPISNTGYYFPVWWALQLGEDPKSFFGATTFTHSHEKSIEMVVQGVVDAAAVDHLVFEGLVKQRPEIEERVRIIEKSPDFGIPPVVTRWGMDPELQETLRDLLLGAHQNDAGRQAMRALGFERFTLGSEADYDAVEAMRADIRREIR